MASYKEMYLKIFNCVTRMIGELEKVQQECEEMYMNNETKPPIELAEKVKEEDEE